MGHFEDANNCYEDITRKVVNLPLEETVAEFVFGRKLPWQISRPIYKRNFFHGQIWLNEKIQNFQDDEFHIRLLGILKPKYLSIDETDCFYRADLSSLKKYDTPKGFQDIINSLFEYYGAVFTVFTVAQKKFYREEIIRNFYKKIKVYLLPSSDISTIKKTIILFRIQLMLSWKELFLLYSILYLNFYYRDKKGYYKLTEFLFSKI
jgi:hypothetical protein